MLFILFIHLRMEYLVCTYFLFDEYDQPSQSTVLQSSIQNGRKWKICIRFLGPVLQTKTRNELNKKHTSKPKKAATKIQYQASLGWNCRGSLDKSPNYSTLPPRKKWRLQLQRCVCISFAGLLRRFRKVGNQNRSQLDAPLVILDKETVVERNKFQWHRPQQSEGPRHILNHHLDESATCVTLWCR